LSTLDAVITCAEVSPYFFSLNEDFHSTVQFDNCSTMMVMGKGDIKIKKRNGFVETILNVLYVPDSKSNLLSVGQLEAKGIYCHNFELCL